MKKLKYVMVGVCPNCQKEYCRPAPCDSAVCSCSSAVVVELAPALILPPNIQRKVERLAKTANVSVEAVVNAVLEKAVEDYERGRIAVSATA